MSSERYQGAPMGSIEFNPDELALVPGNRIDVTFSTDRDWRIWFDRPQGDMYAVLERHVERICKEDCQLLEVERQLRYRNFQWILIGVAALDECMPSEAIYIVRHRLKSFMPIAAMCWRSLELFRAVARMGRTSSLGLPEKLSDPRRAWGNSVLRSISGLDGPSSKNQYIDSLRAENRALKARQNPFDAVADPELHCLIEHAFRLTYWDESVGLAEARRPNHERRDVARLRKNINERLADYRSSLATLATYLDGPSQLVMSRRNAAGQFVLAGDRNQSILDPTALQTS